MSLTSFPGLLAHVHQTPRELWVFSEPRRGPGQGARQGRGQVREHTQHSTHRAHTAQHTRTHSTHTWYTQSALTHTPQAHRSAARTHTQRGSTQRIVDTHKEAAHSELSTALRRIRSDPPALQQPSALLPPPQTIGPLGEGAGRANVAVPCCRATVAELMLQCPVAVLLLQCPVAVPCCRANVAVPCCSALLQS